MLRKWMMVGMSIVLLGPVGRVVAQGVGGQDGAGGARQGRGGGQFAGMQRVGGEVTGVSGATVSIKDEKGVAFQVVTTDNTRIMKGRAVDGGGSGPASIKVADLKAGDGLIAMGNLDAPNKTLHAAMIIATDAAQVKALKDNMGKTYIAGKVTAIDIDNAKMTVLRSDGVSQVIGFDETTSFKRGRANMNVGGFGGGDNSGRRGGAAGAGAPPSESITLADIKVGDTVGGRGSVKSGVFVPGELSVATPGQGRRRGDGAPGGVPASATPAGAGPGTL